MFCTIDIMVQNLTYYFLGQYRVTILTVLISIGYMICMHRQVGALSWQQGGKRCIEQNDGL